MFASSIKTAALGFTLCLFCLCAHAESYDAVQNFSVKGLDMTQLVSRDQIESAFEVKLASVAYEPYGCEESIKNAVFPFAGNNVFLKIDPDSNPKLKIPAKGKLGALKNFNARISIQIKKKLASLSPIKLGDVEIKPDMSIADFKAIFPISARHIFSDEGKTKRYAVSVDTSLEKGNRAKKNLASIDQEMHVEFVFRNNKLIEIDFNPGDDC